MLDTFQFEGPFARYTLRAWGAELGQVEGRRVDRVRCHDEHEAVAVLRSALDPHALRRLRAYLFELGAEPSALGSDGLLLLRLVARRIVSGELLLERESVVIMSSDSAEFVEVQPYVAPPNTIDEGVGSQVLSQVVSDRPLDPAMVLGQARQAKTLQAASAEAVPFCETCAEAQQIKSPVQAAEEVLATQAKQAKALVAAAASGTSICERCAACGGAEAPAPGVEEAAQAALASQAAQAETAAAAAEAGSSFCERCAACGAAPAEAPGQPDQVAQDQAAAAVLATQANQGQALAVASADGVPFCEQCNC